jgi:membrane protein
MILLNSAAHTRAKGDYDLHHEGDAIAKSLPTLWQRTNRTGLSRLLRFPRWLFQGFSRNNAGDLAAAIAYHSLIAMVPIFFLLVGVAGLFLQSQTVIDQAERVIQTVFPTGSGAMDAFRAAVESRQNSGILTLVSFVTFSWLGTGLISSMARGMNRIYNVRNATFINERQRGFTVIMLFLLFFLLSVLSSVIPTFLLLLNVPEVLDTIFLNNRFARLMAYATAYLFALIFFFVIYRIVPNARQTSLDVWPGAVVSATLFSLMVQVFPIYIGLVGGVNRYGPLLGLISLMVVALYLLAHTILFGSYINSTWQRRRQRILRQRHVQREREEAATEMDGPS